jgi:hypothetical protein
MRARNLKPGFFKNEELAKLPPLARLLFAGLWCYADREGRFEWRPEKIRAEIFPYEKRCDITCHLMSLHDKKLIGRYSQNGSFYGFIPNFTKHQNPHPHEMKSAIPPPPDEIVDKFQCHDMPVTSHDMPVTCNADSLNPSSLNPDIKKIYGEFQNVLLKDIEYQKLFERFGEDETKKRIENLSQYIASKGKKYQSHYATILSWERKRDESPKYGIV